MKFKDRFTKRLSVGGWSFKYCMRNVVMTRRSLFSVAAPATSFILILFNTRNTRCSVTIKCTFFAWLCSDSVKLCRNLSCVFFFLSSAMWIKAKAIKASYDQRVVWTQSNIVLLSWAAVEHPCVCVCVCAITRWAVALASQGAHNCWSCVQTLQPSRLFPVTAGLHSVRGCFHSRIHSGERPWRPLSVTLVKLE